MITIEEIPAGMDRDEVLMSLIELGTQELDDQGEVIEVYCAPTDLPSLSEGIRNLGITPSSAEMTMLPKNTVNVNEHTAEKVLRLIDTLDDNKDVQEVFANLDIPDKILAKIGGSC